MWFWDYTPAWHSYKKPISKKQLQKIKDNFKNADEISKKVKELDEKEKEWVEVEFEGLLEDIL